MLFQFEGISPHIEATNRAVHQDAEQIVMFISFKLEDGETQCSNSEWEALAFIPCLAEVRWMVISSWYPTLVYTDHEALRVLLTGLDNDAHRRIAKWQERLGEYDFRLLHRVASTHFMGIADGLSRLPSRLMQRAFVEDSDGLLPKPCITTCRLAGVDMIVTPNILLAMAWQIGISMDGLAGGGEEQEGGVPVVLGEGEDRAGDARDEGESLEAAAREIKRRKWRK